MFQCSDCFCKDREIVEVKNKKEDGGSVNEIEKPNFGQEFELAVIEDNTRAQPLMKPTAAALALQKTEIEKLRRENQLLKQAQEQGAELDELRRENQLL